MYAFVVVGLVFEAHDEHRVERVDRRHEERRGVPVLRGFADRLQLVVAPGVALVGFPREEELRPHLGGQLRPIGGFWARRGGCQHREDRKDAGEPSRRGHGAMVA